MAKKTPAKKAAAKKAPANTRAAGAKGTDPSGSMTANKRSSSSTARASTTNGAAINIRPGVGMLSLFRSMNYKHWYALGELVDNAIDSYLRNRTALRKIEGPDFKLRIVIVVDSSDGGLIRVWDNAAGINTKNYQRAFITAVPPTDSAGLSQFGIGMKSAACWFANNWRVTTTALGEDSRRILDFDVPTITEENEEILVPEVQPAPADEHGTEIRLWNLHKPPQGQTIGKMKRHLASMYREFLRKGEVQISFNGSDLKYEEPALLKAPRWDAPDGKAVTWKKKIKFKLASGETVTGWAGIREKGSLAEAGLALFRHHRLIVGSADESYRPEEIFLKSNSFRYQRVFGEFHLNEIDVAHTKDMFVWKEREEDFLKKLREALDSDPLPLLRQADNHRSKKPSPDLLGEARKAVERAADAIETAGETIAQQIEPVAKAPTVPLTLPREKSDGRRELTVKAGAQEWQILIDLTSDPADTEWISIAEKPKTVNGIKKLSIRFSLSHPFTLQYGGTTASELEGLIRLGAGLAVAESTARTSGVEMAGMIRRNLNELLYRSLSKP